MGWMFFTAIASFLVGTIWASNMFYSDHEVARAVRDPAWAKKHKPALYKAIHGESS